MAAADLRDRLIALRADAIAQLAALDAVDGGLLALAAHAGAALAAIEAADAEADAPASQPGGRAVVTDDGEVIRLTLYHDTGPPVATEIEPRRALRLAGELLAAAVRR